MKQWVKRILPEKQLEYLRGLRQKMLREQIKKAQIQQFEPEKFQKGINLIGPLEESSGLGQSSRLLEAELKQSGIPYTAWEYAQQNAKRDSREILKGLSYGINIFHINAHEFEQAFCSLTQRAWNGHYNIAFWLWELEDFPERWAPYTRFFDEIWTPAEFVSASIRRKSSVPVYTVPYWITAEYDAGLRRSYFGLPEDKFLFLMAFDRNSVSERKNPQGCIEAFKRAFEAGRTDIGLVIKINHASEKDKKDLEQQLKGYKVYFISKTLTKTEMNSLIRLIDVYVSLHRAEGFGLILAESMLLGTPVIATNYSANTEFMNEEISCLVDCRLIKLENDCWPYEKGSRWADPDIDMAAGYMKRLLEDREYYDYIASAAQRHVQTVLGKDAVATIIKKRYNAIYK